MRTYMNRLSMAESEHNVDEFDENNALSLRGDKEILFEKEEKLASVIQETAPTSYRP
jgi:hypothetical protein